MSDLWKEDCNFFNGFNGRDIGIAGRVCCGSFSPDLDFELDPGRSETFESDRGLGLGLGRRIAVLKKNF